MMKSSTLLAAAFGLALSAGLVAPAQAQNATINLGVVSDYVFRGVSQTNEGGALQGGAEMGMFGGYFGAFASTVDFGNGTDTEVDIFAGFRPEFMGLKLDLGAIAYRYFGAPDDANLSFWELKGAAAYDFGFASLGAAIFWSPNFQGAGSDSATYYEVNAVVPLNFIKNLAVSGAYGRQTIQGPGDYNTWNVGLTWRPIPWLELDGRYHDTDEHGFGDNYDSRFVGGAKLVFSF